MFHKEKKGVKLYNECQVLRRFNELTAEDAEDITNFEIEYDEIRSGGTCDTYYVSFTFKKICRKGWTFRVIRETQEVLAEAEFKARCDSMKSQQVGR